MLALAASVPVGCLATALLVVNNLRDIPTDAVAGQADAGRAPRRRTDPRALRRARRRRLRRRCRCSRSAGRGRCSALVAARARRSGRCAASPRARPGRRADPGARRHRPAAARLRRAAGARDWGCRHDAASHGQQRRRGTRRAARGGRCGRRRRRRRGRRRGSRPPGARRARRTSASSAPATTSTGTASVPQAVPQRLAGCRCRRAAGSTPGRRRCSEPVGAARRRLGEAGEQRLGQPLVEEGVDADRARCGRPAPRRIAAASARSPASSIPAVALISTRPRTTSGRARATCRHSRPPIE